MKIRIFLLVSVFIVENSFAQSKAKPDSSTAGVYLTDDDFLKNKLSSKVNTDRGNNEFGFPFPADKMTIRISTPDTVLKFRRGTIYGYYDCGKVYRYSPNVELLSPEDYYRVEEAGGDGSLTIYTSVFYGGAEHFFSTGLNMPIHRLSISHLEKDFGGLFSKFISDVQKMKLEHAGDIAAKDNKGNFIINKLYQQYITN